MRDISDSIDKFRKNVVPFKDSVMSKLKITHVTTCSVWHI